jgi:hypothetical protein
MVKVLWTRHYNRIVDIHKFLTKEHKKTAGLSRRFGVATGKDQ